MNNREEKAGLLIAISILFGIILILFSLNLHYQTPSQKVDLKFSNIFQQQKSVFRWKEIGFQKLINDTQIRIIPNETIQFTDFKTSWNRGEGKTFEDFPFEDMGYCIDRFKISVLCLSQINLENQTKYKAFLNYRTPQTIKLGEKGLFMETYSWYELEEIEPVTYLDRKPEIRVALELIGVILGVSLIISGFLYDFVH